MWELLLFHGRVSQNMIIVKKVLMKVGKNSGKEKHEKEAWQKLDTATSEIDNIISCYVNNFIIMFDIHQPWNFKYNSLKRSGAAGLSQHYINISL